MNDKIKIGYFIPEFPGQTHMFFWREKKALKEYGIDVELISTRRPLSKIISHNWSKEAMEETTYLFPPDLNDIFFIFITLINAGLMAFWRCLSIIIYSESKGLKSYLKYLGLFLFGAKLSWIANKKGLKHIHVHSCADAANIALFANRLSNIEYSMTLHGPLTTYGDNQRQKWKYAAFCIVITQRLLSECTQILGDDLPKIIFIAPMGVDMSIFKRNSPYIPWNGKETCRIFCCSRLTWRKGYGELIKAIGLLREKGIDARLRIAGEDFSKEGEVRKGIEQIIKDQSLESYIELLGSVSEERIINELESSHIFCLASWNEELGVSTMEAMAMQVPVVVTNVGGVPELVDHGISGLMVTPRDPEKLMEAILDILNNPLLASKLSIAGHNKVRSSFHSRLSAEMISKYLKRNE